MAKRATFVSITHPTAGATLPSPVSVSGICSPPVTRTITVDILHAGTVTKSASTTVSITNWSVPGFSLTSGLVYTASATDGTSSDSKDFTVR
jgi:hypothetical protein